jgi:hypothetical protein
LKRVEALHPVAKADGAQFVAGARLRLRRGIDQDVALRIVAELQAIGAIVEVEANRPPDEAILALDQFQDAEPEADSAHGVDEAMLAQLQSLDGDEPPPVDREAATRAMIAPRVEAAPPIEPVDDARFRPTTEAQGPMELEVEKPTRPVAAPPALDEANGDEEAAFARAPSRSVPAPVDETWQPVPGRLANGALRKHPPVRIAVGVVLGLGLGWMFAQPYASRAERHVAELRADADRERYRPVDEAQARVRALDREADDASTSGALGMAAIWVLVGGAAFAGWWRLT